MRKLWVWVSVACSLACQGKSQGNSNPSASATASGVSTPVSAAVPSKLDSRGCASALDFLVPPQRYGDSDLVRAIVVGGDQVYFRNMSDVFKVPVAGGTPSLHSKGPGLSLSGTTVLWASGDRLLTQSAGEPIFMGAAKSGGEWSNLIDLTTAKLGGGREAATRILQGLGGKLAPKASQADFDGESFYFAEISTGRGANAPAMSTLKTVPLRGGEARTLFEVAGEIAEVVRAGDRLAFMHTAPPSPEQLAKQQADRKAKKITFGARGERWLTSIPVSGGEAKKLMRISNIITGTVLGADGNNVYASGYADENPTKPGIYRVDAASGGSERLDQRVLSGEVHVSGEQLIFVGSGDIEPGKSEHGQLALSAARGAKSLTRHACVKDGYTLHASAVSGKTAFLALFKGDTNLASIARFSLP
ncbi:MAG TPA: hypothetical protein VEX18_09720 [Polyangiaceae bacterium]|nr:hypothetical protein [Polyangiaceae bacterium]